MGRFPLAPRQIPATKALLDGRFYGRVHRGLQRGVVVAYGWEGPTVYWGFDGKIRIDADVSGPPLMLDPREDAAARDHCIRKGELPQWFRDGGDLEPWQSAGLILTAMTTKERIHGVYGPLGDHPYDPWRELGYKARVRIAGSGVEYEGYPPERTVEDHDAYLLGHGRALMLSPDEMALPGEKGPVSWTRT